MTTLLDRPNAALIVIDVQNGVVAEAYERDVIVGRMASLVAAARSAGVPVVWVQHQNADLVKDTPAWEYVPELAFADGEPVVHKIYGDSFEDTTLEAELARLGVGKVFIAGAQTDACIRSTLHGAFVRGYDTVLVGDAHTTDDLSQYGMPTADKVIAHTNGYWPWQRGPGRTASVVNTADVDFGA